MLVGVVKLAPTVPLDSQRLTYLKKELQVNEAYIDVRIRTQDNREVLHLGETRIPMGEKQHLHAGFAEKHIPTEVSGTVKRVGVDHMWARL